jgi:uncharacterized membrane protein
MVEHAKRTVFSVKTSNTHVEAIDKYRGFVLIYIIIIHSLEMWLQKSINWIWGILWLIFDALGAASFIFICGISVSLFYHFSLEKIDAEEEFFKRNVRIKFLTRILCIVILALIMNTITYVLAQGNLSYWVWDILLTIAFARIACYFLQKFAIWLKISLGLFIFGISDIAYSFVSQNLPIVNFLFFQPQGWNTPIPFFGFCFIGNAIGDWIYKFKFSDQNPDSKKIILLGFGSLVLSLIIGWNSVSVNENDIVNVLIWQINRYSGAWQWPLNAIPGFWVRASTPWCFYAIGFNLIFLGYFIRRKRPKLSNGNSNSLLNKNRNYGILNIFGYWSLTIYYLQFLSFGLFRELFDFPTYSVALLLYLSLLYLVLKFWTHPDYGKGIGTFRWLIGHMALYNQRLFNRIYNKKITRKLRDGF